MREERQVGERVGVPSMVEDTAASANKDYRGEFFRWDLEAEKAEKLPLLKRVDVLEPLSEEDLRWLADRSPDIRLQRGQILYTLAYNGATLHFLLEGGLHLYREVKEGQQTLEVLRGGTMFGEAAFAGGQPRGAYAQAIEPCWVSFMGLRTFEELLGRNAKVSLKLAEVLAQRLLHYESRMTELALKEVPARLANLLLRLQESEGLVCGREECKIPTRYTHEQLGAMIGAKRVAVTRALSELRNGGAIELRRRTIYIVDEKALEVAAES